MTYSGQDSQRPSPRVLVLGGGAAGCAMAAFLADEGVPVALVEKAEAVGGRARGYGCKATDECQNCGVCLLGGLFEKVEAHPLIEVLTQAAIWDILGGMRAYTVTVRTPGGVRRFGRLVAVVVATGFEPGSLSGHLHIENARAGGLLSGSALEALMGRRNQRHFLDTPPASLAFIGCFGSRDLHEDSFYCSRVCCAYTTRAAKLLRQYYPACKLAYFYMEMQAVQGGGWLEELARLDVELIQSRPAKIMAGQPAALVYDDPEKGFSTRFFDIIVLSEGIHPPGRNAHMAEILGLSQDANGFLDAGPDAVSTGLFVAGCARWPMRIEETIADAQRVSMEILASLPGHGEATS